jgi:hypothetical protein
MRGGKARLVPAGREPAARLLSRHGDHACGRDAKNTLAAVARTQPSSPARGVAANGAMSSLGSAVGASVLTPTCVYSAVAVDGLPPPEPPDWVEVAVATAF